MQGALELTQEAFGKLDILVNCAGYMQDFGDVEHAAREDYWATWEVNYRGVYWMCRAFVPLLLRTRGGLKTVVNVTSVGALLMSVGVSAYQGSKFALLRFTEFLVTEYGARGLLAFAVHPGNVLTEMGRKLPVEMHECGFWREWAFGVMLMVQSDD